MTYRLALCTLAIPFAFVTFAGASNADKRKKKAKSPASAQRSIPKKPAKPVVSQYSVIIDKSDYELQVFDGEGWLATYPVVFGNKSQADKKMSGDRLTPEGCFRITSKRGQYKWGCILGLDYPNAESLAKFRRRVANGEVPAGASPGGDIAIHGTWPGSDWVVDNYINWTEGCISLKNTDVEELFEMLPVGTRVTIRK